MWNKIKQWLNCKTGGHDWTNPILARDNKPDLELIKQVGIADAFALDTIMYCKHCGYVPEVSRRWLRKSGFVITKCMKIGQFEIVKISQ